MICKSTKIIFSDIRSTLSEPLYNFRLLYYKEKFIMFILYWKKNFFCSVILKKLFPFTLYKRKALSVHVVLKKLSPFRYIKKAFSVHIVLKEKLFLFCILKKLFPFILYSKKSSFCPCYIKRKAHSVHITPYFRHYYILFDNIRHNNSDKTKIKIFLHFFPNKVLTISKIYDMIIV